LVFNGIFHGIGDGLIYKSLFFSIFLLQKTIEWGSSITANLFYDQIGKNKVVLPIYIGLSEIRHIGF